MEEDRKPIDIERNGFIRQTLVALVANQAAAYVHSAKLVEWKKIVHSCMAGTKECWAAILEERSADKE